MQNFSTEHSYSPICTRMVESSGKSREFSIDVSRLFLPRFKVPCLVGRDHRTMGGGGSEPQQGEDSGCAGCGSPRLTPQAPNPPGSAHHAPGRGDPRRGNRPRRRGPGQLTGGLATTRNSPARLSQKTGRGTLIWGSCTGIYLPRGPGIPGQSRGACEGRGRRVGRTREQG